MINYVSTKREYLRDYLIGLEKLKMEAISIFGENIGSKTYYCDNGIDIEVDCYFNLNNLCVIRTNSDDYIPKKGIVKVSNLFDHESIESGLISVPNFTLEGTDGIGKTTVIESLLAEGIVCFDRNLDVICKYMLFNVPMEKRIAEYKKYLEKTKDKILFLVNMDEEEIRRRINSRDVISEFDKYAVEYNRLYYDTFMKMQEEGVGDDKLFLLDCTGFSIEEEKNKIKEIILG